MSKEKVLMVGLGQVGQALFELFQESGRFQVYGYDVDKKRIRQITRTDKMPKTTDVMHICYPCRSQEEFVRSAAGYVAKFKPKLTIIESTVPPETTHKIYKILREPLVHSPIRGMHKTLDTMKRDILFWSKYVGGISKEASDTAKSHYIKLGLKVKVLRSPVETELAKLFETTYRAWMIVCFQEMHRITKHFGGDFDQVVDMLEEIHRTDLNKPLHYPGIIGGHCLIPNTELLLSSYDSEFLKLILKSNQKRKKEMKNPTIAKEVEEVRKRAEALEKELKTKLGTPH